jgi:hypothetical protein
LAQHRERNNGRVKEGRRERKGNEEGYETKKRKGNNEHNLTHKEEIKLKDKHLKL